jgi:hypothetical protein
VTAEEVAPDLDARLHGIATRLLLKSGGWADDAIDIACALVVAGLGTPATLDVCALSPGVTSTEAEPLVRAMLSAHGVPVLPDSPTDGERYAYLVHGFGLGAIDVEDFYGQYYSHLSCWDEQSPMERRVTLLLDDWEHERDEARRHQLVAEMRAVVRSHTRLHRP